MDMVERVARAIDNARFDDRANGVSVARAAIAAMREPTQRMLWSHEMPHIAPDDIRVLWCALIDAALSETTEGQG